MTKTEALTDAIILALTAPDDREEEAMNMLMQVTNLCSEFEIHKAKKEAAELMGVAL